VAGGLEEGGGEVVVGGDGGVGGLGDEGDHGVRGGYGTGEGREGKEGLSRPQVGIVTGLLGGAGGGGGARQGDAPAQFAGARSRHKGVVLSRDELYEGAEKI
jgi:hypothetical protein